MLKRLRNSNLTSTRRSEWPENPTELGALLFAPRAPLRRLVVVADVECLVTDENGPWGPELVLSGLLTHEYVKLYRFADAGPPADIPRKKYGPYAEAVPGWIELLPQDGSDVRLVAYADPESMGQAGIIGNRTEVAQRDEAAQSYKELGVVKARAQREADSLAAQAAEAVNADLFVTNRPYLSETKFPYGVTICSSREALALVGLYLRAQGRYVIYRGVDGRGTHSMNKGLYYWVGTRELLPAAWRWFGACVQHATGVSDQELIYLGGSLLRRVQTALQSRDELHIALDLEQNNDTAQEVLNCLDVILVSLMGAVDVAARVAHHVLGLQSGIYLAGWQKEKTWLKEVQAKDAALAAVVGPDMPGRHTITILRLLRNSVHGQALSSLAVRNMGGSIETRVRLPEADAPEILTAMDALGGRSDWGVKEIIPGRWDSDPGQFVEKLVPHVFDLLNDLMKLTPVEQLSHVSFTPENELPPSDQQGPFNERGRESIRWQLGF
jgi:hypothetical protein